MDWLAQWSGDGSADAWLQDLTGLLTWALVASLLFLVPLLALFPSTVRGRRFWCPQSRRDVEVEFEERGLPGLRRAVAVRSCSAFDPPTAVACRRRCLDPGFRRRWEPPLPVRTPRPL